MGRCEDDTSACAFGCDGYFGGRSGCQTYVDHVESHAHECACDEFVYHGSGESCVASHYDGVVFDGVLSAMNLA